MSTQPISMRTQSRIQIPKVDVIIPALNEEATIADVIASLRLHPSIGNVIVAIDGATGDATGLLAHGLATVVTYADHIRGKGQCIMSAMPHVRTDRVMFCDADISGLALEDIDFLVQPHTANQLIVVPIHPTTEEWNVTPFTNIGAARWAWPMVSGERSLLTSMVPNNPPLHGYLTEIQLNKEHALYRIGTTHKNSATLRSPLRFTDERMLAMERDRRWGVEHGLFDG